MINKYVSIPYSNFYSYLIVGFILAFSVVGILGNILTLVLIRRTCSHRKFSLSLKLTLGIAIVDIVACISGIVMHGTRIVLGFPKIFEVEWFCSIFSFTTVFFAAVTSILMSFLAAERYFRICFSKGINRKLGYTVSIMFLVAFLVITIGNSYISQFTPDPTYTYCLPYETPWARAESSVGGGIFAILTTILMFCYINIFIKGYQMTSFNSNFPSRQLSLRALLFLSLYSTIFLPLTVFTVWDSYGDINKCPWLVFAMIPLGMTVIPTINPILVLFLHSHIKKEASNLFASEHKKGHLELSQ